MPLSSDERDYLNKLFEAVNGVRENTVNVRRALTQEPLIERWDNSLSNIEDITESLLTEIEDELT